LHERFVQQGQDVAVEQRLIDPRVAPFQQLVDALHEGDARELVRLQRVLHRGVDGGAELLHHGERREGSERRGGRRTRARTGARAREV